MRSAPRGKPIIRLLSVASSCKTTLSALRCADTRAMVGLVQASVGDRYRVTASARQIEAVEDDLRGGRGDDAARALEIERTFGDDRVAAAVAVRGGAWLTRILARVDFEVLALRRTPIALFGFSELTPLLNLAARYPRVFAYHDLCPGFLLSGMTEYATRHVKRLKGGPVDGADVAGFARKWARSRFREAFGDFFRDVVSILDGGGSARKVTGRWVRGRVDSSHPVTLVGGNLTTMVPLLSSRYAEALCPDGRWLLLEDIRETPDRVDRLLSHLSLGGWLGRYEGIVFGRFRARGRDVTSAVLACIDRHLDGVHTPIVLANRVGHVWPISPLPLGRPFYWRVTRTRGRHPAVAADIPWPDHSVR